jgi:predicted NBD/HSP70 family sugar kinase
MSTARARESDPLLRRTVTRRARGLGVASMIALGVGACAVVVVAGFGNARGGAVGTAAPSTTLRARLGAATSAKTRATMIEAKKAEMEKMAREIDDLAPQLEWRARGSMLGRNRARDDHRIDDALSLSIHLASHYDCILVISKRRRARAYLFLLWIRHLGHGGA